MHTTSSASHETTAFISYWTEEALDSRLHLVLNNPPASFGIELVATCSTVDH